MTAFPRRQQSWWSLFPHMLFSGQIEHNSNRRGHEWTTRRRHCLLTPTRHPRRPYFRGRGGDWKSVWVAAQFLEHRSTRIPEEVHFDSLNVDAALRLKDECVSLIRVHVLERFLEGHQEYVWNDTDDERPLSEFKCFILITGAWLVQPNCSLNARYLFY